MKLFSKILRKVQIWYLLKFSAWTKKNVECPFCGWTGKEFLPNGVIKRKNALCPQCGSLERHRLYYLYLKKVLPQDKNIKVLHFAPEEILTSLFKSYGNIDYLSVDLDANVAMQAEDITKLSFTDNSFDVIFCAHVLEHIVDDGKAMRELRRVLRPGGFAILQVPLKNELEKTYEDFTITDPLEREKAFEQVDHVRLYGRDYRDRLEAAGLIVQVDKFYETLEDEIKKKYGLKKEDIYFCSK